ncbi:MAG: hypothetical protein RR482_06230, partial [Clostridia bacterium]
LFLAGDLMEKGPDCLGLLRFLRQLSVTHRVYALQGNCDTIAQDMQDPLQREALRAYLLTRRNTLPGQMCMELGLRVTENTDMAALQAVLCRAYATELAYLTALPHVIETPAFRMAHSALQPGAIETQAVSRILRDNDFFLRAPTMDKPLIVGHMPVSNFRDDICCCNPVFDTARQICFIDGGNELKIFGQLNGLVLPHGDLQSASYWAVDGLPCRRVTHAQAASAHACFVHWPHYDIIVQSPIDRNHSLCLHPHSGQMLQVVNAYIDESGHALRNDYTDNRPALAPGDRVSIVEEIGEDVLIKKDGVVGWTTCAHLDDAIYTTQAAPSQNRSPRPIQ